jgi:hypothetical protein
MKLQNRNNKLRTTRKKMSRKICEKQLAMGKKVLKQKTLKNASNLLKKVPYMREGDFEAGLGWWEFAQRIPEKYREKAIAMASKPMLKRCMEKYSDMNN